jgi:CBS-domain-containing membrane protein
MRSWSALVLAPLSALAAQSIMYALVMPSCAHQLRWPLHLAPAVALVIAALLTALAFRDWKHHYHEPAPPDHDSSDPRTSRRFLAMVGTAVGSISCLVIAAMWFGAWVLSPCSPWP